ncbi:MAG: pyrrolo-quinoline quinone, partial [Clostridia bacterium]
NKATLYGVGYPGQPVIVKWPTEVRQRMAMEDAMKQVTALKEVIVSGQDGNIYFYNLLDGTATREPIKLGAPSAGGLSVATNGTPILGVGQSHSK